MIQLCFVLFCFELPLHRVLVWSLIGLKVTAWPKRRKKTSNKKKGRAFWGRGRLQQGAKKKKKKKKGRKINVT